MVVRIASKICIVYYSRTGNTEYIVGIIRRALNDAGIEVDTYRVRPVREYSKPLHLNPRVLFDTLMRGGTTTMFDPGEPAIEQCSAVIAASPIWMGTLAPPVQEFLRRYTASVRHLIVVTTSVLAASCSKIERRVEKLRGAEPALCVNIDGSMIRDRTKVDSILSSVIGRLKDILR